MVNLLIFEDEKTKDAVTYHSWEWDVAIFCCLGWNDQYLQPCLPVIAGVPGRPARSLGEDATLSDILLKLDEHYGIVMMFNALSTELHSLQQGSGENVAQFRVCFSHHDQILQSEYLGRIKQEQVEEMKQDHFYEGLNPKY